MAGASIDLALRSEWPALSEQLGRFALLSALTRDAATIRFSSTLPPIRLHIPSPAAQGPSASPVGRGWFRRLARRRRRARGGSAAFVRAMDKSRDQGRDGR